MARRPGLSKGEQEVARRLGELGEAGVRQVHESFPAERGIDFATVQTYLRRLEAKGYARGRTVGRTRLYTLRVRARTVLREAVDDLVDRLFGGEKLPLVVHLLEDQGLSGEDLDTLRSLLDRLEGGDESGSRRTGAQD